MGETTQRGPRRNHYAGAIAVCGIAIPLTIWMSIWLGLCLVVEAGRREVRQREARYAAYLADLEFVELEEPKLRADAARYEWLRRGAAPGGGERVRRSFESAVAQIPGEALTRRRFGENADPFPGGCPIEGASALGVMPEFSGKMSAFQAVAIEVEFANPGLFLQRLTMTPVAGTGELAGADQVVFAPEYVVFAEGASE